MNAARQIFLGRGGGDGWWGLKFVALSPSTVGLIHGESAPSVTLVESRDGGKSWNQFDSGVSVSLDVGDVMFVRAGSGGNLSMASQSTATAGNIFNITGEVSAQGDARSLLNGDEPVSVLPEYAFSSLFYQCKGLVTAPECKADVVSKASYSNMFYGCSNLVSAPSDMSFLDWLPSGSTTDNAVYFNLFMDCSSLVNAPVSLGNERAVLGNQCMMRAFENCSSLQRAPKIRCQAASGTRCLYRAFYHASVLSDIEVTFTSFTGSMSSWLAGVAATGTFRCPSALGTDATIERSTDRCPVGWAVINTD